MFTLSERCKFLKNEAMNVRSLHPLMTAQYSFYALKAAMSLPPEQRTNGRMVSVGLANAIENVLPIIQQKELIVGYNYGCGERLHFDPEIVKKQLEASLFSPDDIEWYLSHIEEANHFFLREAPVFDRKPPVGEGEPWDEYLASEMASMGFCLTDNHSIIAYEKVVRLGFEGILEEVERNAQKNGDSEFYENIRRVCHAACHFGERYAAKAEEMALTGEFSEERKAELRHIAEICRQVPRYPARTFEEAIQSLWFAHIINTWEDGINANSLGRLDQIFYPYYEKDIENGILTDEKAFELICCLWVKLYLDYDVQQSCVGGCDVNGNPVINKLSYLMLDATEALDFIRDISVRFSSKTEKPFIERALEVVGHVKKGVPFFFNDDVMVPALISHGIAPEDAFEYTELGCVETAIPGKSNPHAVTARANLLKAVEYALANGYSMQHPDWRCGPQTGDPLSFTTFEQLLEAVNTQIDHIIRRACNMTIRDIPVAGYNCPKPYKSLLTEGCLESGKDFNDQGAKYDYYQIMLLGLPNLADSLAAVRDLVFEQKRFTMEELLYQLKNDFPDEAFRLDLIHKAPKFGNDDPKVDQLANQLMDTACRSVENCSKEYGYCFHAQPFTFLWLVDHGRNTAATPDGRRNGENIAYSVSPMQGRDFNGFTALINSLSCLPTKKAPACTSAIVEADPQLFTDKNIPYIADIMLTAAAKGLSNIQFNIVNAETLIDAQKHPEKHRNLAVRVSGFSQKFCLLDKPLQDHIIARTKHTKM